LEEASKIALQGIPLPSAGASDVCSLTELIFQRRPGEDPDAPLVLGTAGHQTLGVSLSRLRASILELYRRLETQGLGAGDTICLLRLPRTSEAVVAAAYAALSCMGVRVFMPMYLEETDLPGWLRNTSTRALLWAPEEAEEYGTPEDAEKRTRLASICSRREVPLLGLQADLGLYDILEKGPSVPPATTQDRTDAEAILIDRLTGAAVAEAECLVLTTSGSAGRSKLVAYRPAAFLRSCLAWQRAGLFAPDKLGGRGLCLLLSHSMGIRTFWNAVWTREPICLVPPEWFVEHPERAAAVLEEMQPQHLTGGPGVFRTLLEFVRAFPGLNHGWRASLRRLVSTGAPFDEELASRLRDVFDVSLESAFGTTETQQVMSTLVPGPATGGLGNPLPGVEIDVAPWENSTGAPLFRMRVRSPFGCSRILDRPAEPAAPDLHGWYATGDLVELREDGIHWVGRESDDFLKDGFGVKVSRHVLEARYARLGEPADHLAIFPLREEPGLAALVFIPPAEPGAEGSTLESEPGVLRQVRARIEARNERLRQELDDMELRLLLVTRFACVRAAPPETRKGNMSRAEIGRRYGSVVRQLTGPWRKRAGMARLGLETRAASPTVRLVHPGLGPLMEAVRLDQSFHRGRGDRLFYRQEGEEREIIDLVGGFGVNLLGYRHPDVMHAVRELVEGEGVLLANQASRRDHEGELARRLALAVAEETGRSWIVRFASTGAEAVEMALAHAWLEHSYRVRRLVRRQKARYGHAAPDAVAELARGADRWLRTQRPAVLTLDRGFHGKTLGARALSGRASHGSGFDPMFGVERVVVPRADPADAAAAITACETHLPVMAGDPGDPVESTIALSRIVAAFVEPIQGEGGVRPIADATLRSLAGHSFPLVIDEIQSGLGRTGRFLDSAGRVTGDYYLLGKALGGGVAKISAVLIDRARYQSTFDREGSSTFAGDEFSCGVALSVLDVIERDQVPDRAARRGARLRDQLLELKAAHPNVVREVRGRGLILGLELDPDSVAGSLVLRMAAERERLALLAAAYLLNRHGIRVLPTLSSPHTLRLQPSAYVDDAALDRLLAALRAFCEAVERLDTFELLGFLVREELALPGGGPGSAVPTFDSGVEEPAPGAVRVAFLNHFTAPARELAFAEPGLRSMPPAARTALFGRLATLAELKPTTAFARNLFGGRVWFASVLLPVDSATLEAAHRSGERERMIEAIQDAIEWSRAMDVEVAGLGAYTSILTGSGTALHSPGIRLTTGNSLTAAVGARRVARLGRRLGGQRGARLGVIGSTGNIGRALALDLASPGSPFRSVLLVGRNAERLDRLAWEVRQHTAQHFPDKRRRRPAIRTTTSLRDLRECDVLVIAAATNGPLVEPHHLSDAHRVVIADLSVPSVVGASVRALPNVRVTSLAGAVAVPGIPDFAMSPDLAPGRAFTCAAEAMLLALEPAATRALTCTGPIDLHAVRILEELAAKHGMLEGRTISAQSGGSG
jgi:acetylornithine/succinyldiaminopimelate/putrescine aminotransferase/predicted amino acid dehydrogenase/acyl-coenzyme A synthetase/AMP-(fatty) acid ligase